MKTAKSITQATALLLAASILFSSCASTTMIRSNPSGANVYLNGESVGTTPYPHRDTKIVGSTTTVRLEKEGYAPFETAFSRNEEADVGAIIGGLFFVFPFLWTMKYKPMHTYDLQGEFGVDQNQFMLQPQPVMSPYKADQLRELKQLLDEEVITQQEYETQKGKLLSGN